MDLGRLVVAEDAVSPVIGVILMVAVTVILAAVIGTFVLGVGQGASSPTPQASWEFDYDDGGDGFGAGTNDQLTVTHKGGDRIEETLTVQVDGKRVDTSSQLDYVPTSPSPPFGAGNSIAVEENSTDSIQSGDSVFVIYRPDKPDFRALIGESTVPN